MKTKYPISDSLQSYINIFKDQLTKPQFHHISSLIMGNLHGHGRIRRIADSFSDRDQSSLSRFLLSDAWDHEIINDTRISFANEIGKQKYKKYYSLIIDDGVTVKYGKQLPGVGYYYSHKEGKTVWGQTVLTSHLITGGLDIPLHADVYLKKNQITDKTPKFRSKIEIAIDHIDKFCKIKGQEGVVISDSWFSSESLILKTIEKGFIGLYAIKANRKIKYGDKFVQVTKVSNNSKFDLVTVKGSLYRYFEMKTNLNTGNIPVKLLISQLYDPKNDEWSNNHYLISTDVEMKAFTMLYLYAERWKIESFYKFVKEELGFKANQHNSYLSFLRFIYIIFMSFTYLALQRCKLSIFYQATKSHYESKTNFMKLCTWLLIVWCIHKALEGESLIDIRLKLAL